jgi:hypothetical protein
MGYIFTVYIPKKEPIQEPNNNTLREKIKEKLREIPEFQNNIVLYTIKEIE